jgi:serine/threonine protein kinase
MGDVYLAEDTQLGRPVALKILPEKFSASRTHLRRFEQEARATSALNHPNILTIYEIGQFESTYFIAAEYVRGQTVRYAITHRRLTLLKSIDIAIQVCSGLQAAHAAGVIHRDIKPENVMVREDGFVKVLDFGLAKLIHDEMQMLIANRPASEQTETASGIMVGTVAYMSPEQLRGLPIDARTDVWSLGVVLYEMLTRQTPFQGVSNADVIATILGREFQPLHEIKSCPVALEEIVRKALTKDREQRYQSITSMHDALTAFRDQIRADGKPEEAQTIEIGRSAVDSKPSRTWAGAASVSALNTVATVSLRRYQWLGLAALAIVLLVAGAIILRRTVRTSTGSGSRYGEPKLSKLIDTGRATDAAISPDGKYVAYTVEEGGKQSLWVKQIISGNSVQMIPPAELRYEGMTFSPDVNYIFYVSSNRQDNVRTLFRLPILGGVAGTKILEDIDTPVSFSPDGKKMVFVRGYPSLKQTALITASVDGTSEHTLATRSSPDDFGWKGGPAWSPDGQTIVTAVGNYDLSMHVVQVNVGDGNQKELLTKPWPWIGRLTFLRDGSGFLMMAKDESTGLQQVWFVSTDGKELKKLTGDLDEFSSRSLSITSDSQNLVIVQTQFLSNIWVSRKGDELHAQQVGNGRFDGLNGLSWTLDGKIIYASRASGSLDLWIMDGNGENRRQLTSESGWNYEPAVSHDGRFVVFTSSRGGHQNIWKMDITGNNVVQLTKDGGSSDARWSPDDRFVVYKSYQSGKRTLWKVSADGGDPQQVTDKYSGWPDFSPDGQYIACEYWNEQPDTKTKLAIIPVSGGAPLKEFNWPAAPATAIYLPRVVSWTRDGHGITYADNSGSTGNIWMQPADATEPKQLTHFQSDRVLWFDWSRDGNQLAVARGVTVSDVVMVARIKNQ